MVEWFIYYYLIFIIDNIIDNLISEYIYIYIIILNYGERFKYMVDFCSNIYNLRSFEIKYVFIYKIYYIFIYVVIIYGYITNFECD